MHIVRSRKSVWLAVVLVVLLGVGYTIFCILNPNVGFAYYEPSYLPPNISIKAKRISINRYAPTQVEQNFRTEDWVYSIGESKANESIGYAAQNYDSKSTEPMCSTMTTRAGTEYRLCHWVDYGKIGVQEIKFIKNTTFIYAQIPTEPDEQISVDEISKFVDSFEKKSTVGMPVLRSSGA